MPGVGSAFPPESNITDGVVSGNTSNAAILLNTATPRTIAHEETTRTYIFISNDTGFAMYDFVSQLVVVNASANSSLTVHCREWSDNQHMLYHLGNLCIAISFLTLSSFKYHLIFLRSLLVMGFIPLVLWAGLMKCMLDLVLWNVTFLLINCVFISYHVYVNYPLKLEPSLEELYKKTFKPLKVTSIEYDSLVRIGNVKLLNTGITYAVENSTLSGYRISILLRGRLKVSHSNCFLHYINPDEFVDSIEYECVDSSQQQETYQVTITAEEDCSLITWPQDELEEFLQANQFLGALMRTLLGRDISTKMYHIQEVLLANSRKKRRQTNSARTNRQSSKTRSSDYIRLNSITNEDEQSEPLLAKSSSFETCV